MLSHQGRVGILTAISLVAALAMLFIDPIPQDPGYHVFADSRQIGALHNFWNVVSNLPFLFAGGLGLLRYSRLSHKESSEGYLVMCIGILLVGLGSAYYHHAPSNATLLWDRLPMTVAFMALLYLLLSERVMRANRRSVLWLLVVSGCASALYWAWTESMGRGDLRPYALVQFLPMVLIPLMLAMFRQRYFSSAWLLWSFALYLIAKALEYFDAQVLYATGFTGGHALKHVVATAAVLCIIYAVPTEARTSKAN